jgi:hypothetical protein
MLKALAPRDWTGFHQGVWDCVEALAHQVGVLAKGVRVGVVQPPFYIGGGGGAGAGAGDVAGGDGEAGCDTRVLLQVLPRGSRWRSWASRSASWLLSGERLAGRRAKDRGLTLDGEGRAQDDSDGEVGVAPGIAEGGARPRARSAATPGLWFCRALSLLLWSSVYRALSLRLWSSLSA